MFQIQITSIILLTGVDDIQNLWDAPNLSVGQILPCKLKKNH